MRAWLRIPLQLATLGLLAAVVAISVVTGAYYYVEPELPTAAELRLQTSSFQTPLSINSRDGHLIAQYGEQKRIPADLEDIPLLLREAVLAAEDDSFYEHRGIDVLSTIRAVLNYGLSFVTGDPRVPGGSTITQQITRTTNLLTTDYAIGRKVAEIFLAFRIEREFEKDEILKIYLNTYFFGQSSYGVVTAARTYFDKDLSQLSLSDIAIIAGTLPRPSEYNPYNGPEIAVVRRDYVLRRMYELGYITAEQRAEARTVPIVSQKFAPQSELQAGYVGDWVYQWCQRKFSKRICDQQGLTITTTVDSALQQAANTALRSTLEDYDRKHGYRGPIGRIDLTAIGFGDDAAPVDAPEFDADPTDVLRTLLGDYPDRYGAEAAVVLAVEDDSADVFLQSVGRVSIGLEAVRWARPYVNDNRQGAYPDVVGDVLGAGDVVRFRRIADGSLELAQVPEAGDTDDGENAYVEGALISVDPFDGAVVAMTGGYDFGLTQFNRAAHPDARRQPGSSFKPFLYLSALAHGYTLSTIINDAANCYEDAALEDKHCVENYEDEYFGPTRLREVLIKSLNASADRVIQDIGAFYVADFVKRFGFDIPRDERNASLALGASAVTPLKLASAYAVLANGGYAVGVPDPADQSRVEPYFVQQVVDAKGQVLYDAGLSVRHLCTSPEGEWSTAPEAPELIEQTSDLYPPLGCAERVESAQRIFLITDVLKDVVKRGSGVQAGRAFPERPDLAGKTGTTNGPTDVWFAGFNPDIVAVARIGFDRFTRDLGNGEQGGRTAIPAWIDFMRAALPAIPVRSLPRPPGIVELRINPENGLRAAGCQRNTMDEFFLSENQPRQESETNCAPSRPGSGGASDTPRSDPIEDLFR